jgi:anti-sigma factor RsiW
MNNRPISEDELNAFVDQQLDAKRHVEVAAYLESHPEVAARVADYGAQRDMLRQAFSPIADEPVPSRLDVARMVQTRRNRRAPAWWAAAAVILICMGGAGGWSLRAMTDAPAAGIPALALEAADSYAVFAPDPTHPVEFSAADREGLLHWVSERLGRAVMAPDLGPSGYRFMGGRVVATAHGPAALFMYDNESGARLVVLARPMSVDKNAPMAPLAKGPVHGYAWSRNGLGYSLVGQAASETLHPIANEVRRQVSPEL